MNYLVLGDLGILGAEPSETDEWLRIINALFGQIPSLAQEAEPYMRRMFAQYSRAAPTIDWVLDYWWLVLFALVLLQAGSATYGSYLGQRLGS